MKPDVATPKPFAGLAMGLAVLTLLQALLGAYVSVRYEASLAGAHGSVEALRNDSLGAFLQGFHYWGSAIAILLGSLLLGGLLWAGWYEKGRRAIWFAALLFATGSIGLQLTGNVLPMDRHDVQTAVVEAGIAGRTPFVGEQIASLMLAGERFGQPTLDSWYLAHRWVFTPVVALGALLLAVRARGAKGAPWLAAIPAGAGAALALLLPAPSGIGATAADFASMDAVVSWYVWPMHGALRAFETFLPGQGWLGSAVLPGLFVAFLAAVPWLSTKVSGSAIRGTFAFFVLAFAFCAGAYGGLPAPLSGSQEVVSGSGRGPATGAKPIDAKLAARGLELFNSTCAGCHGVGGGGTRTAPRLREVFRKYADAEWYKRFIRDPASVKPGTTMPAFDQLTESELSALAEWLRKPKP